MRIGEAKQALVRHDDHGIGALFEVLDPGFGLAQRYEPSNAKGSVTKATVKIPAARAARAMTGMAPFAFLIAVHPPVD
jgi:hypothetical protein